MTPSRDQPRMKSLRVQRTVFGGAGTKILAPLLIVCCLEAGADGVLDASRLRIPATGRDRQRWQFHDGDSGSNEAPLVGDVAEVTHIEHTAVEIDR
jgi:hypothetical protein